MDLARAPRRAARKKGSGYENVLHAAMLKIISAIVANSILVPRAIFTRSLVEN